MGMGAQARWWRYLYVPALPNPAADVRRVRGPMGPQPPSVGHTPLDAHAPESLAAPMHAWHTTSRRGAVVGVINPTGRDGAD